ncbi:MAG TPA: CBS domain-containing protein, partial [Candidatus Atribacteria bacterium]|nr:CBS domain-containing protein [Candidatus Atribacteria bacterium]
FCEIIPKTIAQSNPEKLSLTTAYHIKTASVLLSPVEIFFRWISNFVIKILTGGKYVPLNGFFTKKDIKLFFEVGEREGALEKKEKSMIEKILNLNETYVKDVMKPRENIVTISEFASIKDAIKLMNREGLSRIPVYRDNLNNIIGFIYAKDFLIIDLKENINKSLKQSNLIHPPYFILENTRITNLLKEFQKRKIHIAVVIDKEKNMSGIVTIEDLLEEIFGEIEDEFDKQ